MYASRYVNELVSDCGGKRKREKERENQDPATPLINAHLQMCGKLHVPVYKETRNAEGGK